MKRLFCEECHENVEDDEDDENVEDEDEDEAQ